MKNQNYLDTAENPYQMYHRISNRAAKLTKLSIPSDFGYANWYDAFFAVLWNGWLSPSTPVLTNMGNERGHPVACSGSSLPDSIRGFYQTRTEIAQLTQRGYGTSWGLDSVRARGSEISNGGTATGPMQPAAGVVQDMKEVSQGTRRGNIGQYINILNPDFDEFIDQLLADPDGWNIGWIIGDNFIEMLDRDFEEADRRWKRVLRTKMITGRGYFYFIDKVNRARPQMYKDKGFFVKHSNLCVTGDTKILTKDFGHIEIEKVAGQTLECWNGTEWSDTELFQTSEGQEVMEVTLSNLQIIKATPYHKWYIGEGGVETRTKDLQPKQVITAFYDEAGMYYDAVTILSVEATGEVAPTYCGTEPKEHKLMFNGVLTGNCSEIDLFNDKDHSFTCVLSSMNIYKYDEWKDTKAVQIAAVFLDAVIEDMLEKAEKEEGFEKVVAFTKKSRAIGLGILGLSSYYQSKSWVFGDLQSRIFNKQITKILDEETLKASRLLARALGEPEWMVGYGERFSHRLAFAPTKSTAIIQGGLSEGIAPVYANVFEQDTAGGTVYRINPVLLPIMKERGVYTKEVMKRIAEAQGSVYGEDWLTDHEKKVFKTAFEINQLELLQMTSDRQKIMNEGGGAQGQSLNFYITAEETEEYISELHFKALMDPHVKSTYYIHSLDEESVYKIDKQDCSSCEGSRNLKGATGLID
jgi:ribonucleotide reductase alpha subunit